MNKKEKYYEPLAEWQERNCTGCMFADEEKVGTGDACCTYYSLFRMDDDGECVTTSK